MQEVGTLVRTVDIEAVALRMSMFIALLMNMI
jgi:hypothetical protein